MSTNEGFQNLNAQNFDANSLANQTSSVIMFQLVADISGSICDYEDDMSMALDEVFLHELKNSHRAADIVLGKITFGAGVKHEMGFTPILNVQPGSLQIKGTDNHTCLYAAVEEALISTMAYRKDLEAQGIDVRSNICIITDGEDNYSKDEQLKAVNDLVGKLRKNEAWANSFTITLIGVGQKANFTQAVIDMGLDPDKCLVEISTSAHDIRKMMGVVSQSVSSSSAANAVQF